MTRGVKLDRWKRADFNWIRVNSTLSPFVAGDGIDISATGANEISIKGQDDFVIEANTSPLQLRAVDSNLEAFAGGAGGNMLFTTFSSGGDVVFDTTSSVSGDVVFYMPDQGTVGSTGQFITSGRTAFMNANSGLTFTNADLSSQTGSIASVADDGGGRILLTTTTPHTIHPNDSVDITNTTNYNGTYTVRRVDSSTEFVVDATFVSTETGTWTVDKDVGEDGACFIKIGDESTSDPLHFYSAMSDILIETAAAACTTDIRLSSCDAIEMTAIGSITMACAYTSYMTITANDIADQTLTLSCSNSGAGSGVIEITSDNTTVTGADIVLVDTSAVSITLDSDINLNTGSGNLEIDGTVGASGSFTTSDGKTVTVTKGIITNIV